MTRYIKRHNAVKRAEHWSHTISTIALIITGAFVFVPFLGQAIGNEALNVVRLIHRVFAVAFIVVPVATTLYHPKNLMHQLRVNFRGWDKDDWTFMKLFVPYLFSPKKTHMPKQQESKSGQIVADVVLVVASIFIALSGIVLWAGKFVAPGFITAALLVHDVAFLAITIVAMAHAYLGAGIFQPYRGSARLMFGDGLVSESDALYHWGHWAEAELASGKNVVEK